VDAVVLSVKYCAIFEQVLNLADMGGGVITHFILLLT
jgi:hypothetical protein